MSPTQDPTILSERNVFPDAAAIQFVSPDYYELSGDGITVSYYPSAAGGKAWLFYHDAQREETFSGDQIRRLETPDLGTVVSVTLQITVDVGSTTFSLLIPQVKLVDRLGAFAFIRTDAITTAHRFGIVPLPGQRDFYTVTPLAGVAWNKIIPL
jgi:hypothetical protein